MSNQECDCEDWNESWNCYGTGNHKCAECGMWLLQGHYLYESCECQSGESEENSTGFITKDSGKREEFTSGAVRDTQDNKPRYDLIPPKGLRRVADLYARGAVKYEDHNWRKGMPSTRFMASMMRHAEAYRAGDRDEDHIAAVIFNALALIEFEGTKWDDLSELWTDGTD